MNHSPCINASHSRTDTGQGGFTLIEVMVAVLLFTFGILALVALQGRAIQFSSDAEDRNRAALLAGEIITSMWGQNSAATLPSSVVSAWVTRVRNTSAGGLPNATATVSAPDPTGAVTITITWKSAYKTSAQTSNQYVTVVTVSP